MEMGATMRRFPVFVCIFLCVALLCPFPVEGDMSGAGDISRHVNLLTNSGFEEGLEGWSIRVGGASVDVDSTVSHSGTKSVRINRTEYGYGYLTQVLNMSGVRAKYLTAGGWALTENVAATRPYFDFFGTILYEDATSEQFGKTFSYEKEGWQHVFTSFSLDETKNLDSIQVFVRYQDDNGTVWFDDISVVWVDTYVEVRCMDEELKGIADAHVKVYDELNFLQEKYSDENGTVTFLLSANKTYTFVIYWKGLIVGREHVEISQDVDLVVPCDISFKMRDVFLIVRDSFNQPVSNSHVEIFFRPLTSVDESFVGNFLTDSDGNARCLVVPASGEISVLLTYDSNIYETAKIVVEKSNTTVMVQFDFVKLGGWIVPSSVFALYVIVSAFVGAATLVVSYDKFLSEKLKRLGKRKEVLECK